MTAHQQDWRRRGGLRRQWQSVSIVVFATLALATGGTVAAFVQVVGHYRAAAGQLQHALSLSAELSEAITSHESLAHTLWNGDSIDRDAYGAQELQITTLFDEGLRDLRGAGQHQLLQQALTTWREVLVSRGLFGPDAKPLPGVTLAMQQKFGQDSDEVAGLIGQFSTTTIADGTHEIGVADSLRVVVIGLLLAIFALVVGMTGYFARRMGRDILRPLEALQRTAVALSEGNLDQRVDLATRHDNELNDLARTLNAMAGALDRTHRDLSRRATHDALTGLPNREAFNRRLTDQLSQPKKAVDNTVSVLFIDLDDFKDINDSFGHAAGDALLAELAGRLAACVRPGDVVARLGGDEFAILVSHDTPASGWATSIANRIRESLRTPFTIAGEDVMAAVSVGISSGSGVRDAKRLLAEADFAMYTAKRDGKGRHELFDSPEWPTRAVE